jgi:hypothetical protein
MRSIHELTLIFSLDFIIFRASSSSTSPVSVSSMTSMTRSARGNRRREESFCMLTRPLNANSMTMQPRSAYEMLSFQKERYPYVLISMRLWNYVPPACAQRTCLSFRPMRMISSISVSFGCLLRSALSLMSRGSNAILWPFSEFSYAVSGVRSSLRFGAGELTRLPSSSPLPPAPAPPLRRVNPELEAIARGRGTSGVMSLGIYWRRSSMSTGMRALGLRRRRRWRMNSRTMGGDIYRCRCCIYWEVIASCLCESEWATDVLRVTAAGRQERSGVPRPMHSAAALPQFRYCTFHCKLYQCHCR